MMREDVNAALARQHKRHSSRFAARVEVHPDQAEQMRLSYPDVLNSMGVVDISAGGLGLQSEIYIPRNLRLTVHVMGLGDKDGDAGRDAAVKAIVRRCVMLDHKPTYQVGLQFVDAAGAEEQALVQTAQSATGKEEAKSKK